MKRRRVRCIAGVLLLCLIGSFAAAEGFTRDNWYEMGLSALEEMTADAMGEAVDCFNAAGGYGQSQNLKTYARSLSDIFSITDDSDLSLTLFQLKDLAKQPELVELLETRSLPSCESLIVYAEAFRAEQAGEYNEARKQYASIRNVLDAQDRMYALTPKAYDQAMALYQQEDYETAAEIFRDLEYKDSMEMASQAFAHMPHDWAEADCTHPRTCTRHGETEGDPLGHDWKEAICTAPRTCSRCGATEGDPLGHDWKEATCTEPKTCVRCGATEGEPREHDWQEATYTAPRTCRACGVTEGEPLVKKENQPFIENVSWNEAGKCVDVTFSKNGSTGSYMCLSRYGSAADQGQEETVRRVPAFSDETITVHITSNNDIPGKVQTYQVVEMTEDGTRVSASDLVEFRIPAREAVSGISVSVFSVPDIPESELQQMAEEFGNAMGGTTASRIDIVTRHAGLQVAFNAPVKVLMIAPGGKVSIFLANNADGFCYLFGSAFAYGLPVEKGIYTVEFYDDELMCPVQGGPYTFNVV